MVLGRQTLCLLVLLSVISTVGAFCNLKTYKVRESWPLFSPATSIVPGWKQCSASGTHCIPQVRSTSAPGVPRPVGGPVIWQKVQYIAGRWATCMHAGQPFCPAVDNLLHQAHDGTHQLPAELPVIGRLPPSLEPGVRGAPCRANIITHTMQALTRNMPPLGELWPHPTLPVRSAKPTIFAECTSNHIHVRISNTPAVIQAYLKKQEVTCGSSKSAFCGKMCNKAITHWIMYSDGSGTPHPPPIDAQGF